MQRKIVDDNGTVRDLTTREVLGWVADDAWSERAAHLIYDDYVSHRGLAAILDPPWSCLPDSGKERWLKLARQIEQIEKSTAADD
jgi:hypothetical protein